MKDKAALEQLWKKGIVAPWFLYDYQLPVYEFIRQTRDPFCEMTRRFGKTVTFLAREQEDLRINHEWVTIWCEPWKEQARNIVMPEMERIQESCPSHLKARFYRTDSFYEIPSTGSRLYLLGVNEDKGEGARGRTADRIVLDEHGSLNEAAYIENEVLKPMLLTTKGELAKIGTPPDDLGHFYYESKKLAIEQGRFIQRTIDAVTSISQPEKDRFIISMGGIDSPAVRRELYCEPVADPERLVIPEYREDQHAVDDDYPRPEFFDSYVGMDLGLNDNTFAVFAYWDFAKAELVIEDEYCANGKNTEDITSACKAKELGLWPATNDKGEPIFDLDGKPKAKEPFKRVADNDLQQLFDMLTMCNYSVLPTAKDNKLAAINATRLRFSSGSIKIKKRCKSLLYQLKVGLWNRQRTDFQRGEKTGHLDGIAALVYLSRNIAEQKNPYPQNRGATLATHFMPDTGFQGTEDTSVIAGAFGAGRS